MAVFPARAAAEAFVADDPFVREGVVRSWQIRDWNEFRSGEEDEAGEV